LIARTRRAKTRLKRPNHGSPIGFNRASAINKHPETQCPRSKAFCSPQKPINGRQFGNVVREGSERCVAKTQETNWFQKMASSRSALSRICGCRGRSLYPLLRGATNPTGAGDGTRANGVLGSAAAPAIFFFAYCLASYRVIVAGRPHRHRRWVGLLMPVWSHEQTDDPLYADELNFYKLEK
jgi:hypothetical protein